MATLPLCQPTLVMDRKTHYGEEGVADPGAPARPGEGRHSTESREVLRASVLIVRDHGGFLAPCCFKAQAAWHMFMARYVPASAGLASAPPWHSIGAGPGRASASH